MVNDNHLVVLWDELNKLENSTLILRNFYKASFSISRISNANFLNSSLNEIIILILIIILIVILIIFNKNNI